MINKRLIIILSILIILTLVFIFLILSIYFFKFQEKIESINDYIKRNNNNKNYYAKIDYEEKNQKKEMLIEEETKEEKDIKKEENKKEDKIAINKKVEEKTINNDTKKENSPLKNNLISDNNKNKKSNNNLTYYSKGSNLPNQNFHSYGDYISIEEEKYRETLINNLKIKTIIIDKLTKGNGISQEYFKVAYQNNMIPAKILEEVVESKEFRNLIPLKYLKDEIKIKGLKKGEEVVFKNEKIKDLLILWKMGRLTPIQKAWIVKADK